MLPSACRPIPHKQVLAEHYEQAAVIAWAHTQGHPALRLLFAAANGGKRHIATAKRLRSEGVNRGVPDLCLPYPSQGYHGLFLEMKTLTGHASPEQKDWIARLSACGYRAEVCRGAEVAVRVIKEYLHLT